jgi:hypothetical protein|tara:strand:- start:326 stop:715 length:390 start_codon:yes stop_codon:yes gene_type:complete
MKIDQPNGLVTDRPNCGVVAVAATLDLDYDVVFAHFRKSKPHQWRGRLQNREVVAAVTALGGKIKPVPATRSLKGWAEWNTVKGGTYIVHVGDHFVAVRDQHVVDQVEAAPAAEHWAANKRVLHAWKVN